MKVSVRAVFPGHAGSCVFTGIEYANGARHRFVCPPGAMFRVPASGEVWDLCCSCEFHAEHGEQMRVNASTPLRPEGAAIVEFLSRHPDLRGTGVGRARAAKLYERYGDRLQSILDAAEVECLTDLISSEVAAALVVAWQNVRQEAEVIRWLFEHGFDFAFARKLQKIYGSSALAKLNENPYRLLAFYGWSVVDAAAQKLAVKPNDPRRLAAAVEAAVYERLHEKHTLTTEADLLVRIASLLRSDGDTAKLALRLAAADQAVVQTAGGWQALGPATMEREVKQYFQQLLSGDARNQLILGLAPSNSDALRSTPNDPLLTPSQHAAIIMGLREPFSLLFGAAGTGKTTVLKVLCDESERLGERVVLLALAGRAAARLREATDRDAYTVAAFLYHFQSDVAGRRCLVIVDEASMLDLPIMYRLVRALPKNARLLLVGDPHQLPPVAFGMIFQRLVGTSIPQVELTRVWRQDSATGIPAVAEAVRRGTSPKLPAYQGLSEGVSFVEVVDDHAVDTIIRLHQELTADGECQILATLRGTPVGTRNLNAAFHRLAKAHRKEAPGWSLVENAPVIWNKNNYQRMLMNGSLGRVASISEGESGLTVSCEFDGANHHISDADLRCIEPAYAITVHKAQGSQFERVVVPIRPSRLLERTLIYTAITRARKQVVLVGSHGAFTSAVLARSNHEQRQVGFRI